jgi:hypothetical protein
VERHSRWIDRDGLVPPQPLLGIACFEALQRWKDKKAETIRQKPLPDVDELNAAIPVSEWELGQRPMKTEFGMKSRPEFIIGWKILGDTVPGSETPLLSGPIQEMEPEPTPKTDTPAKTDEAAKTLDALVEVRKPTAAEELADEIPW